MVIIQSIAEMKAWRHRQRAQGKVIGLVPTMGYLHQGHLTLMQRAKAECDVVVASIFVNPLQFGLGEDYEVYPRDLTRDSELAETCGVEAIFAPAVAEMYPKGYQTFVNVEEITQVLCGKSRPGHFRGVTTVVNKLFNIVSPDKAYFGQKDAQQVQVISRMVADLNMDVELKIVPIVREADGLAMSSRNVYLSPAERAAALVLNRSLRQAEAMFQEGERSPERLQAAVTTMIEAEPLANIDYVQVLGLPNLNQIEVINERALVALAVKFGKTRLIDNTILEV